MATKDPDFQLFSSLRFDVLLLHSKANSALSASPSPFYMLPYHRDRMLQAATHFGWSKAAERISGQEGLQYLLQKLVAWIDSNSSTPLRVRMVLDYNGDIKLETYETPPTTLANLFPSRIPPPALPKMEVSPLTGGALMLGDGESVQAPLGHGDPLQMQSWTLLVDPVKTKPSSFTTYKTTCRDMYADARARVGIESNRELREVLIISNINNEIMEGSMTSIFFWRGGRWVTPPVSSGGQAGTTRRWLLENGHCEEEVIRCDMLIDGEECWVSNGVRGLTWGKIKL